MDKTEAYIERINRVIDYIELHYAEDIQLSDLAQTAGMSKFHFHRIFYAFTGESLYGFVTRVRTERAAARLLSQKKSITDIAFSCGFHDSATFSRAFKKHFAQSASDWKKKQNSKIHQDCKIKLPYSNSISVQPLNVTVNWYPDRYIAYVRHSGEYAGDVNLFYSLYKKLMNWAEPAGMVHYPQTKTMVIYHDSPGITECDKLRISVGITVPEHTTAGGEIGCLCVDAGRYISCSFEVHTDEYGKAWSHVFRYILPQRGLQPAGGYCFELYPPDCYDREKNTTSVTLCVPVEGCE
jgi:AraC family transcriptional regulator